MAAPSIPNLNSLRGRGGLRRGYGRGRPGPTTETEEDAQETRDKIIRQTDGDASSSRLSAVALGYLNDAFARSFVDGQIPRRYPLINRGTYVRTSAIDRLVNEFLDSVIPTSNNNDGTTTTFPAAPSAQIVSLGAGSDTRFFRLPLHQRRALLYHELDFTDNTIAKVNSIQRDTHLKSHILDSLSSPDLLCITSNTTIHSSTYNLHSIDIRLFATSTPPTIPNLRSDLPTLVLSECCLCYLPPQTTTSILSHFTSTLLPTVPISLILYEPIRPYDSFGRTMITNLSSRGIALQTLKKYYSLEAQRLRLRSAGFVGGQGARDVEQIYYGDEWVGEKERERVERLEWLDEVEEWRLLARHYCVAWGWRDGEGDVFGKAWKNVNGQRTENEAGDDEVM